MMKLEQTSHSRVQNEAILVLFCYKMSAEWLGDLVSY